MNQSLKPFKFYRNFFGTLIFVFFLTSLVCYGEETQPTDEHVVSENKTTVPSDSQTAEPGGLKGTSGDVATTEKGVAEPARSANDPLLEEARAYAGAGEFLKAQESYKWFLAQEGVSADSKKTAESELESLNMKIFFSPTETEDSTIYTVKPGDNLYNIAKEYGTTVGLIQKVNQLKGNLIKPGMKLKIVKAQFSIEIDKSDNTLRLLAGDEPIKTYRVGTGKDNSTPVGQFTITNKLENPTWYKTGAVVPPDSPDNILGTRWLGFSLKGYGIHGTTLPESIGKQESSGCVRMLNQDVEELYSIVPTGTKVIVVD